MCDAPLRCVARRTASPLRGLVFSGLAKQANQKHNAHKGPQQPKRGEENYIGLLGVDVRLLVTTEDELCLYFRVHSAARDSPDQHHGTICRKTPVALAT